MTYSVKSLLCFSFTTGEQTGENFYSNTFIYVKSKFCVKKYKSTLSATWKLQDIR